MAMEENIVHDFPDRCAVCGGIPVHSIGNHIDQGTKYSLYECGKCKVQFWWPMLAPGAEWYRNDIRYKSRNADPHLTPVNIHRVFLSDNPSPGGTLLDVGCGTGNFLAAAEKKGYRVRGIDFDRDAISVAINVFGLKNVSVASLENIVSENKVYDVVTFFEVLEHMDKPNDFMESVKKLLSPDGFVALSVPFRGFIDVLKPGDRPPRHLTRWDDKSIKIFLELHGFKILRLKKLLVTLDHVVTRFHFWTKGIFSFGLVDKVRKSADNPSNPKKDKKLAISALKRAAKVKDYTLFFIPSLILFAVLLITGKGYSGMYVLAERKK